MKKLGIRKLTSLLLAVSVTSSLFLCACDGTVQTTETTETTEATEFVVPTPPNGRDTTPYLETKLDGNRDHHFLTTDFCYIESDKYVLFLEKNLDIPGDFTNNLDKIIAELEKQLGLSVAPAGFEDHKLSDVSDIYGSNPWENWRIGPKIAIYVYFDRDGASLNEAKVEGFDVKISLDDLLSEDYWNSTKSLRYEWITKSNYIQYEEITRALAQAIVIRNSEYELSEMAVRGIGEYMSRSVLDVLGPDNQSLQIANLKRNPYFYKIPEAVNADNAERFFINGFYSPGKDIPFYAPETYGRYFFKFLNEQFGDEFFLMYIKKVNAYGVIGDFTHIMKVTYGDDIFRKFGDWCIENQVLQYVEENNN